MPTEHPDTSSFFMYAWTNWRTGSVQALDVTIT